MAQRLLELSMEEVDALVIAELRRRHHGALAISIDYEPRTPGGFCHVHWVPAPDPLAAEVERRGKA